MNQYLELLDYVLKNGESHDDRTGVGTLSVFGYQVRFDLTRSNFPLLTTKKVPFRWVAEELFWFLSGDTNEENLRKQGVDIWKEWADEEHTRRFNRPAGDLGPIYGFLWRHFGGQYLKTDEARFFTGLKQGYGGVDQIARLLKDLTDNPQSRRHIVTGWDPKQCDAVALPPCHTLYQFKVHRDESLSCHLYARSIDSFLGLPFNIASYALLTRLVGAATRRPARELVISFGDLHIYKNHIPQVQLQLSRQPIQGPKLAIAELPGDTPLERLLNARWEHLSLIGYSPMGRIAAEVAV